MEKLTKEELNAMIETLEYELKQEISPNLSPIQLNQVKRFNANLESSIYKLIDLRESMEWKKTGKLH